MTARTVSGSRMLATFCGPEEFRNVHGRSSVRESPSSAVMHLLPETFSAFLGGDFDVDWTLYLSYALHGHLMS